MSEEQEKLVIRVVLDDADAKRKLQAEAKDIEGIGAKAKATYKAAGQAAVDSAGRRSAASRKASEADVEALGKSRDALGRFAGSGAKDFASIEKAGGDLAARFQKIALAGLSLNGVASVFRTMTGAMHEAVDESKKQVDNLLALKNSIRDIASMTGSAGGSSDAFVQKFLEIRKASGLDNSGARAFVEGFAGSGEAKKGVNISPEEYEKAKPLIAKFAAANSAGDAGATNAFGNLSGLLLGFAKDQTAGGALKDLTNFNEILKAGVGDNPTLIREASTQAGAVLNSEGTGIVRDPNQLAALISTASIQRSAGQASTVVGGANRVLRDFQGPSGEMLTQAGIRPEDDLIGALNKIFARMDMSKAGGVLPDQFLGGNGVAKEDRDSIMALYNGRGYLDKFLGMAANPMSEADARKQLEATFRADVGLQGNVGQAKLDEAKLHNAMAKQHMKPLELEAEARLTARGEGEDSPGAAVEDESAGWMASGFGLALPGGMSSKDLGRKMRREREMNAMMKERGIDVPGRPSDATFMGGHFSSYPSWLTTGGADEAYAQATSTDYMQKQVGGAATPPMTPQESASTEVLGQLATAIENLPQQFLNAITGQTKDLSKQLKPPAPRMPVLGAGGGNAGRGR